MGIRKEIKLVIKEHATCTIGANEAINAIANIVSRPKQKKLFPEKVPREALDTEEGRTPLKTNGPVAPPEKEYPTECAQQNINHLTFSDLLKEIRKTHPGLNPFKGEGVLPEGQKPSIMIVHLEDVPFPELTKEIFKKF